jgi:hypothetical protein
MLWNSTEVYFKRKDRWQIAHTHWSFVNHGLPKELEISLPVELTPVSYEGLLGELMALESAAIQRWRKGDPWGFVELYAPEITYMDSGTPARINGIDAMKRNIKNAREKSSMMSRSLFNQRFRFWMTLPCLPIASSPPGSIRMVPFLHACLGIVRKSMSAQPGSGASFTTTGR